MKICTKCKIEKELEENFPKCKANKSGYRSICKICKNKEGKEYYESKKELISIKHKNYYESNKDEILKRNKEYMINNENKFKQIGKEYYENNKEKILIRHKNNNIKNKNKKAIYDKKYCNENKIKRSERKKFRRETDMLFKFKDNSRRIIYDSLKRKGFSKKNSTEELLGCSLDYFYDYIENQFKDWMTWENWGKYTGKYNETWQLDHIICLDSAKTEEDVIKLSHYLNFQPLCSKQNSEKSNNLNYKIKEGI